MEYESGKSKEVRMDLLDGKALIRLGAIMKQGESQGKEKDGWRKREEGYHLNKALSHLAWHMAGDKACDHLAHAMCRVMMEMGVEEGRKKKKVVPNPNGEIPDWRDDRYKVYVCAPLGGFVQKNVAAVKKAVSAMIAEDQVRVKKGEMKEIPLYVVPHFALNGITFVEGEETNRELGINMCLSLMRLCHEVVVLGERCTEGMRGEISLASELGMPVRWRTDLL